MTGTLGDMIDRIADEISRDDLASQTRLCIKSAIQHYQRKRFYFTEDYSTTFNTVASQEYYTSSDNAAIPNFAEVDSLVITALGTRWPLDKRSKEWFDNISSTTTATGIPADWMYYAMQFRLYPIPDGVYSIRASGLKRLDEITQTASSNVFTSEGEALIRAAAKRILYTDYLKNDEDAMRAGVNEKIALDAIMTETVMRTSSGFVPTQF